MERINVYYLYNLGRILAPLKELKDDTDNLSAFLAVYYAEQALDAFLKEPFFDIELCSRSATQFKTTVSDLTGKLSKEIRAQSNAKILDWSTIKEMKDQLQEFDTALSIQSERNDTYVLTSKGTHDTRKLLSSAEAAFSVEQWGFLPDDCRKDWKEAAKCLAYGVSTACGFHALRALEGVALEYVTKLQITPQRRDLGHYLDLLKSNGADLKAIEAADQLRGLHRNPLMHPQDFLEIDEALDVLDLCKSAIKAVLRDMKKRALIP